MTDFTSTKPYIVRAIHEWCIDNACTPHLLVAVDGQARVPVAYVKDGEIVLNLSYTATKDLHIENDAITFSARFGGVSQNLFVPMNTVKGIFARENGQGMFFEIEDASLYAGKNEASDGQAEPSEDKNAIKSKKPTLTIVK